jgi:hypothetical protein
MNKNIFQFYNGVKIVHGDPMAIHRRLRVESGHKLYDLIEKINEPPDYQMWRRILGKADASTEDKAKARASISQADAQMDAAALELQPAIVKAFPLVEFNQETGEGATEDDARKAMNDLAEWLAQKKTNIATQPKTSTSSAGSSSARPLGLRPIRPGELPSTPWQGEMRGVQEKDYTPQSAGPC